jgi:heptosyltransferase I
MRVLIVRHSSIGDIVHTLPTLSALHRHGNEVSWVAEPPGLPLLEGNPQLARVVRAPAARSWSAAEAWGALRELRRQRFDVALDFGGLWKSATWARLSGARRVLGFAPRFRREPSSAWLLGERAERTSAPHVIDKNLSLLGPLGIEAVGCREFPLPPTEEQAARVVEWLDSRSLSRFVILNPGGGWSSKLWSPQGFGAVAVGLRERGLASVVTFGPGEMDLADALVKESRGAAVRAFPTTLLEYAELARRARLVLAADTGPLHLACALGTPVVGLYGPTDPARNGPFSPHDQVVRRAPSCAPCHRRRCPVHDDVMRGIPPSDVLSAIDRRLEPGAAAR